MSTGRCEFCLEIRNCPVCNEPVENFSHVGVRGSGLTKSTIWHIAHPCGHRVEISPEKISGTPGGAKLAKYKGGPVWKDGYQWINVFWGSYWVGNSWVGRLNKAVEDIESNSSYSGELSQYNVGAGSLEGHALITTDPPSSVSEKDIGNAIN